jgi:hypothetical protein
VKKELVRKEKRGKPHNSTANKQKAGLRFNPLMPIPFQERQKETGMENMLAKGLFMLSVIGAVVVLIRILKQIRRGITKVSKKRLSV